MCWSLFFIKNTFLEEHLRTTASAMNWIWHLLMIPQNKTLAYLFFKDQVLLPKNLTSFVLLIYFIDNYNQELLFSLKVLLTHLFPMHPFPIPWKHQKTIRFSKVSKRRKKGALATNGLNKQFRTHFSLYLSFLLMVFVDCRVQILWLPRKTNKYLKFLYSSLSLQLYLKKDSGKKFPYENFSEQLFHRTQGKDSFHLYTVLTSFKVARLI